MMAAGTTPMIKWTETISHPGCFLIEFAKSDAGPFQQLSVYKHPASNASMSYSSPVKLPDEPCVGCILRIRDPCVGCILRIRQVMMANNTATCPPANLSDTSDMLYYSCANIVLQAGGATDGGADAAGDGGSDSRTDGSPDSGSGAGGTGGSGSGGTAGAAAGGTSGTGGAVATGGASGAGGKATGGTGTGGSSSGTGGSSGNGGKAGSGTGGTGAPSTGDSGGGCSIANVPAPASTWAFVAMVFGLLLRARRRRR
jgi:MYXO-CTERM domain-containing protein